MDIEGVEVISVRRYRPSEEAPTITKSETLVIKESAPRDIGGAEGGAEYYPVRTVGKVADYKIIGLKEEIIGGRSVITKVGGRLDPY